MVKKMRVLTLAGVFALAANGLIAKEFSDSSAVRTWYVKESKLSDVSSAIKQFQRDNETETRALSEQLGKMQSEFDNKQQLYQLTGNAIEAEREKVTVQAKAVSLQLDMKLAAQKREQEVQSLIQEAANQVLAKDKLADIVQFVDAKTMIADRIDSTSKFASILDQIHEQKLATNVTFADNKSAAAKDAAKKTGSKAVTLATAEDLRAAIKDSSDANVAHAA